MGSVGHRTVECDGLHGRVYLSPGPGSGTGPERPVFVLVHGIGVSHRYLARLHARLARSGPVCSIDLPGFGTNPKPRRQLSVADFAAFIAKALQASGIASCIFVGHSMGVQFGLELARTHPGLVSRLVLMGPVVDMFRRQVVRQALALGLDMLREPPSANFAVISDYVRCGPRWYLTELPVMMAYETEDRILHIPVPVLIIRGSRDPVADRRWCRLLAERAANGRLLEIAGQGHVVQHGAAAQVAQAILEFSDEGTGVLGQRR